MQINWYENMESYRDLDQCQSHEIYPNNDSDGMMTSAAMVASLHFDFSFLDDDDDQCDYIDNDTDTHGNNAMMDKSSSSSATTTKNADHDDVRSCCTEGTSVESSSSRQSILATERSDDETTIHSPTTTTCRDRCCIPTSPYSIASSTSSSLQLPTMSLTLPSSISSFTPDDQWEPHTTTTGSICSSSQPPLPSLSHYNAIENAFYVVQTQRNEVSDEYAWCIAAASRVMASVDVYGKLLMRLRDGSIPKSSQHRISKSRNRRYNNHHHNSSYYHSSSSSLPPKGWMTHDQIMQHVPKLLRLLVKTSIRFVDHQYSMLQQHGPGNNHHQIPFQSPEQRLRNNMITPLHILYVLQHVNGVRTMSTPCPYNNNNNSDNFYYSLDWTWLLQTLPPKLGYNPTRGNIVVQLVEQRLLYLLDHSPEKNHGRYCTNEISRIYELTFHEPLLFKPLGYQTFKDLINDVPSLQRVYDDSTVGRNGIQWYIERSSHGL